MRIQLVGGGNVVFAAELRCGWRRRRFRCVFTFDLRVNHVHHERMTVLENSRTNAGTSCNNVFYITPLTESDMISMHMNFRHIVQASSTISTHARTFHELRFIDAYLAAICREHARVDATCLDHIIAHVVAAERPVPLWLLLDDDIGLGAGLVLAIARLGAVAT